MPEVILPCPACGSDVKISGGDEWHNQHSFFIECQCGVCRVGDTVRAECIGRWNALPRSLTWTHEPPKVAGWYWMRRKLHGKWRNRGIVHIYMDFAGTKTLQAKGWGRQVGGLENMGIDFEWAGPIAPPID